MQRVRSEAIPESRFALSWQHSAAWMIAPSDGAATCRHRRIRARRQLRPKCSRQDFSSVAIKPFPLQAFCPLHAFIEVLHSA